MNKNRGFIGIGLILAIVLGIVVIGGGAYYFGTKNNLPKNTGGDPARVNQDNQLQENQNQPVVDNIVKAVTLDMSSELAKTYATAFTNALKQPANFDGHYVVASWGCGSGCLNYGIVDKLTGKVYKAPGDDYGNTAGYSGDADFNANRWLVSSNIFKVIGYTSIDSYKFDNEKFTKIGSNSFPINSGTSNTNWKTYTNTDYGFSFNYPNNWKLSEDKNKREVTIDTNDVADAVDGYSYPSWSITFQTTDKTFFTSLTPTKMGIIKYDENLSALVADDNCLKAEKFLGYLSGDNTSSLQVIIYGGSLMSDPAYSNSAMLTSNGDIIIINEKQGMVINPEIKSQLSIIANSFKLLNNNKVFVPECAK